MYLRHIPETDHTALLNATIISDSGIQMNMIQFFEANFDLKFMSDNIEHSLETSRLEARGAQQEHTIPMTPARAFELMRIAHTRDLFALKEMVGIQGGTKIPLMRRVLPDINMDEMRVAGAQTVLVPVTGSTEFPFTIHGFPVGSSGKAIRPATVQLISQERRFLEIGGNIDRGKLIDEEALGVTFDKTSYSPDADITKQAIGGFHVGEFDVKMNIDSSFVIDPERAYAIEVQVPYYESGERMTEIGVHPAELVHEHPIATREIRHRGFNHLDFSTE